MQRALLELADGGLARLADADDDVGLARRRVRQIAGDDARPRLLVSGIVEARPQPEPGLHLDLGTEIAQALNIFRNESDARLPRIRLCWHENYRHMKCE